MGTAKGNSWWEGTRHDDETWTYAGVDESAQIVMDLVQDEVDRAHEAGADDPILVLLGFSQGAGFTSVLVRQWAEHLPGLSGAIMVSGFPPRDRSLWPAVRADVPDLDLPSLHVIGHEDKLIEPPTSEALATFFASPRLVYHDGGHYVPSKREVVDELVQFVEDVVGAAQVSARM
jgi:predicted esterase